MQIGFVGLGRMGANMVARLLERGGHQVVAYNRSPGPVEQAARAGAVGAHSLADLAATLAPPRSIWLMVPAGAAVDETLEALTAVCTPGDVFIDGGNSYYQDSMRRAQAVAPAGFELMDAGTSGGIWGREIGYALMVGGSAEAFARIEPVLQTLAPAGGYAHVGPSGAGHFSKMVHNGIEYGLMQAYAEGLAILAHSPFSFDLRALAELWNHGSVIRSWLLELAARALAEDPRLDKVAGFVEDTGEGRWTVAAAIDESVPAPVITAALYARFRSREAEDFGDKVVAVLRQQFGGHATRPAPGDGEEKG